MLDYCGISTPAFWQGYGRDRDLSEPAQVRRVFYLLCEIQKYVVIHHGCRSAVGLAVIWQAEVVAVE